MFSERPRPSLRILVAESACQAALRSKACQTSRPDHIYQMQGPLETNLGQPGAFQLTVGYKPRLQSSTANRFHKGAVFVPAKVKDAEIAVGRVPSVTLTATKENRRIANSIAPLPEVCRRREMYQRLPVIQVRRGWIDSINPLI